MHIMHGRNRKILVEKIPIIIILSPRIVEFEKHVFQ